MSVLNCFTAKIAAGTVKAEAGNPIARELAELEAKLTAARADADAVLDGYADFLADRAKAAAREKLNAYRSIAVQMDVMSRFDAAVKEIAARRQDGSAPLLLAGGKYRESVLSAVTRSMYVADAHELVVGPNVNAARQEVRAEALRLMAEAIEAMRPKMLGLKEETALEMDILRALFGEHTANDASSRFAKAWLQSAGWLREQFNEAGGDIGLRDKWLMPQSHDSTKVASVNREDWKAFVTPLLDRAQMLRKEEAGSSSPKGGSSPASPLDDDALNVLLDKVYDAIIARGIDGGPTSQMQGKGALANQRSEARILAFKDADGWLSYKEAFGAQGGVFSDMMAHVRQLSDDIGMMRVLGPNPDATHRYMLSLFDREPMRLQKEAAKGADAAAVGAAYADNRALMAEIGRDRRNLENLHAEMTGANGVAVSPQMAAASGTMRTWLVAAQLGSAMLSAVTDLASNIMTRRLNGLPVSRMLPDLVRDLADPKADLNAAQLGLASDTFASAARQHDQVMGEEIRAGRISQIASAVLRASGIDKWTRQQRSGFAVQMMGAGANAAGKDWAEISPALKAGFARVGITQEMWARTAGMEMSEPGGVAKLLTVHDMRQIDEDLASRWSQLIHTEMDFAVYDGNPLVRSVVKGQSQPGTVGGEVRRMVGTYKGFALNILMQHGTRAMARGWNGERMGHAAQMFVMMTLLGAVAMQAKHVAAGRDPVSLDPTEDTGRRAWLAAMIQGGGLGIFGDLMFTDKTRMGNSWATAIAGPQAGMIEDVLGRFVLGNTIRALKGEATHFAGDALYVGGRYLPGSSLWFARLAFQRQVLDQLALQIDERAPARFARMEAEAAKNFGQSFWFAPGTTSAARAPDLSQIGGTP
jgi:hypothetical protein